ncbi:MAG: YihY/virulence factor BrkB family protein [Lachnospiraceae bacterium]|nr:YihY/virulence factor BrkB family protein [Lachnospiraceae bacterium]
MFRKIYIVIRDFASQMKKKNISAFSAGTAFFFFLSLAPMLILICTIIPYTPLTEESLIKAIMSVTPQAMNNVVINMVADVYEKSAKVLSVAAVATFWSAGKGVLALMRGLNAINDVEEERNYFYVRMVASFYTVVMLVGMVLSLLIMVFGNVLIHTLLRSVPQLQVLFEVMVPLRYLLVWLVLTVLFTGVYTYVPNKKMVFREQIPGAMFSAVAWSLFSWGFSLYVDAPGTFSTYGSMAIIIVIMLWLYFCMYIIMIGAHLNLYFKPANKVLINRTKI